VPERHLGRTLGRYRVDEVAGSGGFAWVYKAYDPELDIPVALKVLKPQFAGDAAFEERFRREASTAAKLRHPNIIKIYAVGRDGDAVYFAMDYLPNGLADRLEVTSVLPEEFVIRVGMDVASALGFAHREGVIHRDIKVDNILFDAHGNAVVADFGIARAVSGYTQQTGTNMVVGTPQYFAPEQARAKPLDGRADIYSLGVTLYRAATGQLPFGGDDWYEIARQHVEDPPPAPREVNPALTPAFEGVLLHCLEKHPDDRPATGDALCEELAALLPGTATHSAYRKRISGGEPTIVVDSTSSAALTLGGRKRRRASPALIAGAVVVALAALAIPVTARWLSPNGKAVRPADTLRTTVPDPPATATAPPDSAMRAAVAESLRRDSVPQRPKDAPAAPKFARLAVNAPPNARILFDGKDVGQETWSSDSVPPGSHDIAASVESIPGCSAAIDHRPIQLSAGRQRTKLELTPRECGRLVIDGTPKGALFKLVDAGGASRSGRTPSDTLVVPLGAYVLSVSSQVCYTFTNDTLHVLAHEQPRIARFKLECGRP
jgi:hypothetical protein